MAGMCRYETYNQEQEQLVRVAISRGMSGSGNWVLWTADDEEELTVNVSREALSPFIKVD